MVDVDFIAFYQTAAFGDTSRWQINWFAPVKGYELTTRKELIRDEPDHPRANEEYYKIQIGSLQHRSEPITADKWKRITFLYTTGELFNQARIINDLVVRSDERQILWRNLRDRAAHMNPYLQNTDDAAILSDPAMLEFFGSLLMMENSQGDHTLDF